MLTIIAGVVVAGSTLLARKLYKSFSGVISLSDDLDPLRPPAHSELKTPSQAKPGLVHGMTHEDEPCAESILRLSGAVAGSGSVFANSQRVSDQPEVPATVEPA